VTPMCPVGVGWVHFKCPLPGTPICPGQNRLDTFEMYPNCNHPKFANQICNVSPMRSIGRIHAGYILNVPHFSDVIALCLKCGRSIKLGTLRSHDWVHSKSDQHFSQEQIKTTFMGTFSINSTFAHWAHWSHLLSVFPMYPACAWWVFGSLSPVIEAMDTV